MPPSLDLYKRDAIQTASPGQILVMLYQALLRNIEQADAAMQHGDRPTWNVKLIRAQEIVWELRDWLNPEVWDQAPRMAAIYQFLLDELVGANIHADRTRLDSCRRIVTPLLETWTEAAALATAEAVTPLP